jgi:hypothetical protein
VSAYCPLSALLDLLKMLRYSILIQLEVKVSQHVSVPTGEAA